MATELELQDSLIDYPCDFPVKVFGQAQQGFAQSVLQVVLRHDPTFQAARMEMRNSKKSNYLCLTCTVCATSREQLDALYRDLCDHPMVKMVL